MKHRTEGNIGEHERSILLHPVVLGLLAITLFGLSFMAFVFLTDDGSVNDASGAGLTTEPEEEAQEATVTTATEQDPASPTSSATSTDATELPTLSQPDGAFVEATLNLDAGPGPGLFRLSGRVPDQETASALLAAAELSYAPFVESDIEVDETLGSVPWLQTSPRLIGLLPSVTDGTILVADGEVQLTARSPNPLYLARLEGALTLLSGMPVEIVGQTITDLTPPEFYVEVGNGKIALEGFVPSEGIRQSLIGAAAAAYGAESVTSELTINEDTYVSFWMYTMPGVFQLFLPFPKYEVQVVNGVLSGTLQGGVGFAVDSTALTEQAAQVLNIGAAVMARDISIFMIVEGHTDSSGPDAYNMALSEARAASVVAYLEAAGISPDRLQAIGAGETDPIAPNDTDEGKALNRRVEFIFGPPPSS